MKKIYATLILALIIGNVKSQTGVTNYTISGSTGIIHNCLKVDGSGNKWFGTNRGLIKFDGTIFTQYDTLNSGLQNEWVNDVAFDGAGNMWVGTRKGLTKFDGTNWTTYNIGNSNIPNDTVYCILPQGSSIYIGTKNGVGVFNGTAWTVYNSTNSGLSTRIVNCLAIDLSNDLYVGTNVGLFRKSGSVWISNFNGSAYYPASIAGVRTIYVDANNTKWLGGIGFIYTLTGNSLIDINNTFTNCGYIFNNTNNYSIIKGPLGGVMFTGNQGTVEIVGGQVYFYSGANLGRYLANDNAGLIWGIPYSGTTISSFNYLNYSLTNPIQPTSSLAHQDAFLDVNKVKAQLMNRGDMFWDIFGTSNARYEVPKGTGRNAQFASALWIGGIDNGGLLHEAAMTYRQIGGDYFTGPLDTINGTTDSVTSASFDRMWKLNKLNIAEFRNQFSLGNVQNGTYAVDSNIITWPAIGTGNYTRKMALFVDVNNDGLYKPLVDGDYPLIKGDQMIYWIFNDNLASHTETGALPLKVEIHASAYAFACPHITDSLDVLNYTTFYNYKIFNRSTDNYHQTYIGFWDDADLGFYGDDYTACNPSKNYGMILNGTATDGSGQTSAYGIKPPMNSSVILNGPLAEPNDSIDNNNNGIVDEAGEKNLMTSFIYFNNTFSPVNGNPTSAPMYYNYMHAYWGDSTHVTYGGNGTTVGAIHYNFMFDGALNDTIGWTEMTSGNVPSDRRFVMGCGPFNLNAGASVEFDMAQVFTRDTISTYSIRNLYEKNRDDVRRVQQWFAVDSFPSCLDLYAGVNESRMNSEEIGIYPNPTSGVFQISDSRFQIKSIKVMNILGETIYQSQINNQQSTIDLRGVDKGIYFVQVHTESGSVNKKIVIE